jgi:acyl-CoA thioester hydrolase
MKPSQPGQRRQDFKHLVPLQTRWSDNDLYGHVNNVVYYSYFDTVINRYLIDSGVLDLEESQVIGVCAESQCRYLQSIAFPEPLEAGLRVGRLGKTSVTYELGIFRIGIDEACAVGHFVHVFVDQATRKPVPVEGALRTALERLVVPPG